MQTGDVEEESQSDVEVDVPTAKEAFVAAEGVDDSGETTEHIYDGYELLLDIDESLLDDHLPAASGLYAVLV